MQIKIRNPNLAINYACARLFFSKALFLLCILLLNIGAILVATGASVFFANPAYSQNTYAQNAYSQSNYEQDDVRLASSFDYDKIANIRNSEEFQNLASLAEELGDAKALYLLAMEYKDDGMGFISKKQVANVLKKSSELGNSDAMLELALMHKYGSGVPLSNNSFRKYLARSADAGNAGATYELAEMFENANGVFQDIPKSLELYNKAMELGSLKAYFKLASFYLHGVYYEQDYQKALEVFEALHEKAEDQETKAYAIGNIANIYSIIASSNYDLKAQEKALVWYLKAAKLNNLEAMIYVANSHRDGIGTEQDYKLAVEWYKKIATMKNYNADRFRITYAMVNIGYLYSNGLGVEQNYKEALGWYLKAAELGNPEGAWHVGNIYYNGYRGISQDLEKANLWFDRSKSLSAKWGSR